MLCVPGPLEQLWLPHGDRYVVCHGGRGSGKSWGVAARIVRHALEEKCRILCVRQFQNSIAESAKTIIENQIEALGLSSRFIIQEQSIMSDTGSEILFRGMDRMAASIKSMEGIGVCWIEEGQDVSSKSLETLLPTIRRKGAIIYININPRHLDDAVYKHFLGTHKRYKARTIQLNHSDNPLFPDSLKEDMEADFKADPLYAEHIWNGALASRSSALIFKPDQWRVDSMRQPETAVPNYGLDIGMVNALTACVEVYCWNEVIYVAKEVTKKGGVAAHKIGEWLEQIAPTGSTNIRSDHQTSFGNVQGRQAGFTITHAKKGDGSVVQGIDWLKNHDFVVNPSCHETIRELGKYSYKIDSHTGEPDPFTIDKVDDHCIDAIRYAVEPLALGLSGPSGYEPTQYSQI